MSGLTVKVSDSEDFRWGLEFWITYPGHSEKSWTATFWNSLIRGICSSAPRLRKLTDRPSGCDNMNKAENTHNSQSQSRNSGLRELGNRALFPNPDQGTSGTEQCNMVVERINPGVWLPRFKSLLKGINFSLPQFLKLWYGNSNEHLLYKIQGKWKYTKLIRSLSKQRHARDIKQHVTYTTHLAMELCVSNPCLKCRIVTEEETCRIPLFKLRAKGQVSSFIHSHLHKEQATVILPLYLAFAISSSPLQLAGSSFLPSPRD